MIGISILKNFHELSASKNNISERVPTVQVAEGSLQQLGEAWSPGLSWGSLTTLEVRSLLVLQFQLHQLQDQGLLPHCPLSWRPTQRKGPQVRNGETKLEDGVWGEEGEGGAQLSALGLGGEMARNLSGFIYEEKAG